MKVLFISHEATRTGAPISLLQEIRYICEYCKDIEPIVFFLRGGELLDDFRKLCPVYKGWIDSPRLDWYLKKYRLIDLYYIVLFKIKKVDRIYANSILSFEKGAYLKGKLGGRLIGHVHEAECLMKQYFTNGELLKSFDLLIAVSRLAANNLINNYDISPKLIRIQHPISLWVEKYLKKELVIRAFDYKENAVLVGCICSDEWAKATDVIPLFLQRFCELYPNQNFKLVLIGKLSDRFYFLLNYILRKIGLKDRVIIIGRVENPLDYLIQLDAFLLLSREESFGLAAQEAAILEIPIIGFYGATGAAEWIQKGAGILVPFMDFGKMAEALFSIISDTKHRKELGRQARKIVTEMYENDCKMETIKLSLRKDLYDE